MGGPRREFEEQKSQATPLAEDYLKKLQGQLSSSAFGTGVGPLQQEAGTALRQFITSLQGQGGVSEGAQRLISGLTAESERRTEQGAANLREQHGIAGQRFGTTLSQGESAFRSQAGAELDQLIGGIQEGSRQFDANKLLASIGQLFGQGQANIQPFSDIAALGIAPEHMIVSPSTGTQIVSGITGLIDAASPAFPSLFGGGRSPTPGGSTPGGRPTTPTQGGPTWLKGD